MKLQQLRYLLAIVDNDLNITAAAERLYTSQPGVSKQLKLLEDELSIQIFSRKGKSLGKVTPAGEKVIQRARIIMREVENIRSIASEMHDEQHGTLSIGTTHTQARYVLPQVIKVFRERYPKVNLNLHQGTSEQLADMLAAREIDFAIATGSKELFPDAILLSCYHWDRIILAPHEHAITRYGETPSLEQVAEFPLVSYVFSFKQESSLQKAFVEKNLTPNVVFTARDADVIKTYVRMGMGVGIVASMACEPRDLEDLTVLSAEGLFPRLTTWIGFRKDTFLRAYMMDFIEMFASHLNKDVVEKALQLGEQQKVETIFENISLPLYDKKWVDALSK